MIQIETVTANSQIITLGKYQTCKKGEMRHE